MIAYQKNELVGITEASKALGNFVDKIASHTIEKIAIIRNNKPEAVMLSIGEYERIRAMSEAYEHEQIAKIMDERVYNRKQPAKMISQEEMMSILDKRLKNV